MATKKVAAKKPHTKKPKAEHKTPGPKPRTRLTYQQMRYIDAFVLHGNVRLAAMAAGCAVPTAYAWMESELVANEIFSRIQVVSQRAEVTQEYVLRALQREADYYGEDAQHSSRVTSLQTLAKILRMFSDSVEIRGDRNSPVQIDHNHAHDHSGVIKLDVRSLSVDQCQRLLELRDKGDTQGLQETVRNIIIDQQGAKYGTNEEDRS